MKVKVTEIKYNITGEDIGNNVDYVLETDELDEYNPTNMNYITISKDIADPEVNQICDIVFIDLDDDTVYQYEIIRDMPDSVLAKLVAQIPFDAYEEEITKTLPVICEFEVDDDYFSSDDPEVVYDEAADLVSEQFGFLVDSLCVTRYAD